MNNIIIKDWSNCCDYEKVNGLYVLKQNVYIEFTYNGTRLRFVVDKGAMTDGLSVPKIFRWYLPDWNNKNVLYNIAGICHDGMYGSELIAKDMADIIFYNGLVKAGISKTKAMTAKYAVQYFAGLHYGKKHDDYGISPYCHLVIM